MARLIDADKRIAEIKKLYCDGCDNYGGVRCRACWVDDAMCLIDDATTVDAVEVVHCRDCKFGVTPYGDEHDGWIECSNIYGRPLFGCNDFCSYGERESNGKS